NNSIKNVIKNIKDYQYIKIDQTIISKQSEILSGILSDNNIEDLDDLFCQNRKNMELSLSLLDNNLIHRLLYNFENFDDLLQLINFFGVEILLVRDKNQNTMLHLLPQICEQESIVEIINRFYYKKNKYSLGDEKGVINKDNLFNNKATKNGKNLIKGFSYKLK